MKSHLLKVPWSCHRFLAGALMSTATRRACLRVTQCVAHSRGPGDIHRHPEMRPDRPWALLHPRASLGERPGRQEVPNGSPVVHGLQEGLTLSWSGSVQDEGLVPAPATKQCRHHTHSKMKFKRQRDCCSRGAHSPGDTQTRQGLKQTCACRAPYRQWLVTLTEYFLCVQSLAVAI